MEAETPNNEAYDNSGCDWSLLTPVKAEDGERTEYEDKGTYELVNEVVCLVLCLVGGCEGCEDLARVFGLIVERLVHNPYNYLTEESAGQLSENVQTCFIP